MRLLTLALTLLAGPALADLAFCNETPSNVSVAIGYKDGDTWASEGWWTAAPGDCTTPIAGDLPLRYYYYRVTSADIEFPVENYNFCTSSKAFTIVGDTDCEGRGFETHMFNELDIGEAHDWTVNLTATGGGQTESGQPDSGPANASAIYADLQGYWQDTDDDGIGMRIDGTRLTDYYLGVSAGGGDYILAETCPGANGAGPVMIVTYDDFSDEPLCWVLLGLNANDLTFRAIGGTGDITMIKK